MVPIISIKDYVQAHALGVRYPLSLIFSDYIMNFKKSNSSLNLHVFIERRREVARRREKKRRLKPFFSFENIFKQESVAEGSVTACAEKCH